MVITAGMGVSQQERLDKKHGAVNRTSQENPGGARKKEGTPVHNMPSQSPRNTPESILSVRCIHQGKDSEWDQIRS